MEPTHGTIRQATPAPLPLLPPNPRPQRRQALFDALVPAVDVIDPIDDRRPMRPPPPPSTNAAEARRSLAITGAPSSCGTPNTAARAPSTRMSAPRRCSSATWVKRSG